MTLQGNLQIEFDHGIYILSVKTILLKGVYYFFIHDAENAHALLSGHTLELVYTDAFISVDTIAGNAPAKIPAEIITAVKMLLLDNKQLWYY